MKNFLLAICLLTGLTSVKANTILVTSLNDSGVGTLRQAVSTALDGDTIRFDANLIASGSDTIKLASSISLSKGMVIKGLINGPDTLFISGENLSRIFLVNNSSALVKNMVLDSLALINGNSGSGGGGCIFSSSAIDTLYVWNTLIRDGAAKYGGAIYSPSGSSSQPPSFIDIRNCSFQNNSATEYGGAVCTFSGRVRMEASTVKGGTADDGGAIYSNNDHTVEVIHSTLKNNTTIGDGGAIHARPGDTVTISNSVIDGNSAYYGGGIFTSSTLNIHGSSISNNTSTNRGGGIFFSFFGTEITVTNSSITGNKGTWGGGIYSQSPGTFEGCTFEENTGSQGAGVHFTSAHLEFNSCTFNNNNASNSGGAIYSGGSGTLTVKRSTLINNSAIIGGAIYSFYSAPTAPLTIINCTVVNNSGIFAGGINVNERFGAVNAIVGSSIIASNTAQNLRIDSGYSISSQGYNFLGDTAVSGSIPSDQLGVTSAQLDLRSLSDNGGPTQTAPPTLGSIAIDAGDPTDTSRAQNMAINGVRDAGAAELTGVYHDTLVACGSLNWYGTTYTLSGDYLKTYTNSSGGTDTAATLNLTIIPGTVTGTDSITHCGAYTWINGITYTSSNNTAKDTLKNLNGCDSIVTLNLTITSKSGTDNITACNSYTWINGVTYTASNNSATDTLTSAGGCDSILTLNLTIYPSVGGTDQITTCNSYTWINGVTYTTSNNTATDTLVSSNGCDSIVTLDLTINPSRAATETVTACKSFTWIDGVTYTSSNNTATDTLTSSMGCDSVVSLDLTINTVDTSLVISGTSISANATGGTYRWLDCNNNYSLIPGATAQTFNPLSNGSYAVEITENGCVDTSACVIISTVGMDEQTLFDDFTIYPNPTSGGINIQLGTIQSATIKVFSTDGQLIHTAENVRTKTHHIELDGTAGMYIIEVITANAIRQHRVLKK